MDFSPEQIGGWQPLASAAHCTP